MMATYRTSACFSSLVLLATIAASTTTFAVGTYEQRQACRADAMKFCGKFVPNVELITECMERNVEKLNPQCRKQFK